MLAEPCDYSTSLSKFSAISEPQVHDDLGDEHILGEFCPLISKLGSTVLAMDETYYRGILEAGHVVEVSAAASR